MATSHATSERTHGLPRWMVKRHAMGMRMTGGGAIVKRRRLPPNVAPLPANSGGGGRFDKRRTTASAFSLHAGVDKPCGDLPPPPRLGGRPGGGLAQGDETHRQPDWGGGWEGSWDRGSARRERGWRGAGGGLATGGERGRYSWEPG